MKKLTVVVVKEKTASLVSLRVYNVTYFVICLNYDQDSL